MAFRRLLGWALLGATVAIGSPARAQYPQPLPPPQPPPPNYYPPPQQPQYYPPQQPQPQPYPPQQPQPYPPPGQPGYYPPPQQGYPMPQQPRSDRRSYNEMIVLYGASAGYGIVSGIWVDSLFKITDPGLAVIAPLALGAAAPVGAFLWDSQAGPLGRGVPASLSTGLVLGAMEGLGIVGTQWQYTHEQDKDWTFRTQMTVTFLMASGGGVAGWAFGEYFRPDTHGLTLIASGAGWGGATGLLIGAGASGKDWKDGASIGGMIGYNVGIVGLGALAVINPPSFQTQKWMWIGYAAGAAAGFLVYPFYLASDADVKHGLIANGAGAVAGATLAGVLSWHLKDDDQSRSKVFNAPFQLGVLPVKGGAGMSAFGEW